MSKLSYLVITNQNLTNQSKQMSLKIVITDILKPVPWAETVRKRV